MPELFRLLLVALGAGAASSQALAADPPVAIGLDHVIVAVSDLDMAARHYESLGFALKPGRPHANGIRNRHVKFEDGSEIELLTVDQPGDPLARSYARHIAAGTGPVYAGLFAPDRDGLLARLTGAGLEPSVGPLVTLTETPGFDYLFFGRRNHSPTDEPAHFDHGNGASSLRGLWIAPGEPDRTAALLLALGAEEAGSRTDGLGGRWTARVFSLREGFVALIDARHRTHPERPVVGVTLAGRSLRLIPPEQACGLWIEIQAPASVPSADE